MQSKKNIVNDDRIKNTNTGFQQKYQNAVRVVDLNNYNNEDIDNVDFDVLHKSQMNKKNQFKENNQSNRVSKQQPSQTNKNVSLKQTKLQFSYKQQTKTKQIKVMQKNPQQSKQFITFEKKEEKKKSYLQLLNQSNQLNNRRNQNETEHNIMPTSFIKQFIPIGTKILCVFHQQSTQKDKTYDLYQNQSLLLSAEKQKHTINSKYNIIAGDQICSEVRGNFIGSEYNIYQNSVLTATVCFDWTFSCVQHTQSICIYLRNNIFNMEQIQGNVDSLKERYAIGSNKQENKITKYVNKMPIYQPSINGFILNFHGLAQMSSIKNTIIQEQGTSQEILIIGKRRDNSFNVSLTAPLTIRLAMSILTTIFDTKIVSQ